MSPMEQRVGDAIQEAVTAEERGIATKWVCLVESIDEHGKPGLWTMTGDGVMAWDTVGMLQHGLHLQLAQTIVDFREDD